MGTTAGNLGGAAPEGRPPATPREPHADGTVLFRFISYGHH